MDYPGRVEQIRRRMDEGGIALLYLRPGANLFYLTGVARQQPHHTDANAYGDWVEGAYLGRDALVFVTPRMGSGFFVEQLRDRPWFTDLRILGEGEDPQATLDAVARSVAPRASRIAVDDRAWAWTLLGLQQTFPGADVVPAADLIAPMRMVKSEDELALMGEAARLADEVYVEVLRRLRVGVTEYEVAHEVDYQFALRGADFPSFVTGVRFTRPGAARPHEMRAAKRSLQPGDAVTFDFGCLYHGYCSDFGRTAFAGDPPAEFMAMHEAVITAQRLAMEAMRAGEITAAQADAVARGVLRDAGYAEYFTHRLGHGIGVTVHEPPYLDVNDQTVLQSMMTFTVEPSVRIPHGYACRLEDVVVVTPSGGRTLMQSPRTIQVIA